MNRKDKVQLVIDYIGETRYSGHIVQAGYVAKRLGVTSNHVAEALRSLGFTKGYRGKQKIWRSPPMATLDEIEDEACLEEAERAARIASDYEPLKPEDYDDADLNPGQRDKGWNKEKKQEFSKRMGTYRDELISGGPSEDSAKFLAKLGEQERRYGNKRQARTVSITAANEALMVRHFKAAAEEYLQGKVEPAGFAARLNPPDPAKRALTLFLSDNHLGANLFPAEGNQKFGPVEEARRLEFITHETCDYKLRYRDVTELNLVLGGDMIEGQLGHDMRAGAPLIEQKVVFWKYFSAMIGMFAKRFPWVNIKAVPGNHGRDIARHPGRATASKWDGHEWGMYYALMMMCSNLPNVSWQLDLKPWTIFDLPGNAKAFVTHADTDVKIGPPLSKGDANYSQMVMADSLGTYGASKIDVAMFGHHHTAVAIPGHPYMLHNGPLVPGNNYAKGAGYLKNHCSQWLFESVPGYPVGDLRNITVGEAQDKDETLGKIIVPFRFDLDSTTGGVVGYAL